MYKIRNLSKKLIAVVLVTALFFGLMPSTIASASPLPEPLLTTQSLRVAVLSEPRIFPQSMISDSPAFDAVVRSDIAMLSESQAILEAAINEIIAQAPDVLLVPGNLTREGEVEAHEHLAAELNRLRSVLPNINIYVINGSRDINNPHAASFASGAPVPAPSPDNEQFRSIYAGLGFGENIYASCNTYTNSYVARPAPGFTVIAIDTATGVTGSIGSELLNWITTQAQAAENRGDTVIAFMHHSLVPHSSIQSAVFSDTLIADYANIGAALAGAGIRYIFTSAMRATNIAQITANGNTLTDISTASISAYPSPIRFADFTRGVNEYNRLTETVEISTEFISSIPNIGNLRQHGADMVNEDFVVSLILDSGLYDLLHDLLDEMEATEFVNTRGVRHTGLRAVLESSFPTEDEYGRPLSNDFGDVFIDLLREVLPTTEAEAMDLGGIGRLWYELPQNRIRVRLLGGFAGNVFMTDANIRNHLVNPGLAQLNNNLLVDRTIVNGAIDQLARDLINMNVYPLPVPDGEGGYTAAGNQFRLFDLIRASYLAHLAGDEQAEQWMLDVIDNLNDGGPLLDSAIDIFMTNLGIALDDVLHTVTINTGALVTSDFLGTLGRVAVVAFLGDNLGSIMSGFGFSAVELVGDLEDLFSDEMRDDFAAMLTDVFLGLLVNYGYPNDNFTTLAWVGGEVAAPVDRVALAALIAEANERDQEDYTTESWVVFANALAAAQAVYDDADATQAQVDTAVANLSEAKDNLEPAIVIPPVDKAALAALIAQANERDQEDYTAESWAPFAAALAAAQAVYDDADATQAQVDTAVANLSEAKANLEPAIVIPPVDRTALAALIAQANGLNYEDYTESSWDAFIAVLEAAQAVYDDTDATQLQIDTALANLNNAISNLEAVEPLPVDRTALGELIAEAELRSPEDYTASSWSNFIAALAAAQTVYDNEAAIQEQVNIAFASLTNAMNNLVTRPAAVLTSLTVSQGTLTPVFAPSVFNYTVSVGNAVTSIVIGATAEAGSTVTGIGSHNLNVGQNTITLTVTTSEGNVQTYTIIVTRAGAATGGGGGTRQPTVVTPPEVPQAPEAQAGEHIWLMRGFEDGTFRPDASITRAELAVILFRLLENDVTNNVQRPSHFYDVSPASWYGQAVNYLASRNILLGFPDGNFRPNYSITRAEMVTLLSRFFGRYGQRATTFHDVSDTHWAFTHIMNAYRRGWIANHDGVFRPDDATSRVEAVTMLNRALGRTPNPETIRYHLDGQQIFTDLTNAHWAFYEIMEAVIEHDFHIDSQGREVWTNVVLP